MAMTRPQEKYVRKGARQGIGFIWFTIVAMPVLFVSLAFAADFARVVMAGHEMKNVADAGALGGAFQIQTATVVLDTDKSREVAQQTVCRYQGYVSGVAASPTSGSTIPNCPTQVTMDVFFKDENSQTETEPGEGFRTIEVEVSYLIPGLIFPGYFGFTEDPDITVVRTASVCVPGEVDAFTGGFCARD